MIDLKDCKLISMYGYGPDGNLSLRDLKWAIAFVDNENSTKEITKIVWQQKYLVCYCEKCKTQRHHTIIAALPQLGKNGHWYINAFYGYCTFCKENNL